VDSSYPVQEKMLELTGVVAVLLAPAKRRKRYAKSEFGECITLVGCSFENE
jgi:hypothetical protein